MRARSPNAVPSHVLSETVDSVLSQPISTLLMKLLRIQKAPRTTRVQGLGYTLSEPHPDTRTHVRIKR